MKMSRTTTAALTGAIALASGAYALGSQEGDGSAVAEIVQHGCDRSRRTRLRPGPRPSAWLPWA